MAHISGRCQKAAVEPRNINAIMNTKDKVKQTLQYLPTPDGLLKCGELIARTPRPI
jgi:hypothetical protein